mgnify:CR=1 FL=1
MFGYVRPVMDRLSQEDQARFQAVYCGLCYELGARYGFLARCLLNYDFTFLALLLSPQEEAYTAYRCPCKRFCKKCRLPSCEALCVAADASVILSYWKLQDDAQDSGFFRGFSARSLQWLAGPAYRRASAARPDFSAEVELHLTALHHMEEECSPSIDRTADAFASILAAAADQMGTPEQRRIHRQMLYHLGRWIYLVDALDDLQEDAQSGKYNPLIYRFGLQNGMLDEESRQRIVATLDHSVNFISSAFVLADYGPWTGVLENVIYYGLPGVGRLVLEGKWDAAVKNGIFSKANRQSMRSERMEPDT